MPKSHNTPPQATGNYPDPVPQPAPTVTVTMSLEDANIARAAIGVTAGNSGYELFEALERALDGKVDRDEVGDLRVRNEAGAMVPFKDRDA